MKSSSSGAELTLVALACDEMRQALDQANEERASERAQYVRLREELEEQWRGVQCHGWRFFSQ